MTDTRKAIVRELMDRHGETYCGEIGIDIAKGTPSPLFEWLVASLLFSARISADIATSAAKALFAQGWRTPEKMIEAGWAARTKVLNESGYARYDESTSRMLEDTARLLVGDYGGDLRKLREAAGRDPAEIRKRLKAFKGIGEVGADVFFREVQAAWDEIFPFADRKALKAAKALGLPEDAEGLSKLVARKDFPTLVAALVRSDLARDEGEVRDAAG